VTENFRAGVRLRRVGRHIKQWREQADRRGTEVAAKLKWSPSKISKMENAAQGIQPVDVLALGLVLGVDPEERDRVFAEATKAAEGGWWQEYSDDELIEITRDYLELEYEATHMQEFKTDLIPGMLQTWDYAVALGRAALPKPKEATMQRRISVKQTRQKMLTGPTPVRFETVLAEGALRTVVGGPEVMKAQLKKLIEHAEKPNITLQVVPFEDGAYPAMSSPFTILGFAEDHYDDVAYVENLYYGMLFEEPATVRTYRLYFTGLQNVALDPEESVAMIAKIAKTIRR
jgi:hypothetical protein